MNNGTGEMSAKMRMSEKGKIIPTSIHPGGSIGLYLQKTGDDINCIISGEGKAVYDEVKAIVDASVATWQDNFKIMPE